jgi:anti-sigma-K factor RskA
MTDHAQYAEALALYAMGALDNPQELADLKAHLGTCGECRRELDALRADAALLALSATGPQPPQRARQRLLNAIAAEPRSKQQEEQQDKQRFMVGRLRSNWLSFAPIAVAMVLAVFSLLLLGEILRMRHRNEQLAAELIEAHNKSAQAQEVLDMLNDTKAMRMKLVSAPNQVWPEVHTIYVPAKGHVLLVAHNLVPLPEGKVYQLWLIPAKGDPMPAGTFWPDSGGSRLMMHAMETSGIEAKAFAVTVEPPGGSPAPTPPIVLGPAE